MGDLSSYFRWTLLWVGGVMVGCGGADSTAPWHPSDSGAFDASSDVPADRSDGAIEDGVTDSKPMDSEAGCVPKTCAQLAANCGTTLDGCGKTLQCGDCPSGQTCGGGGANTCGNGTCKAKTCAQLGASCGMVSDFCSDVLDCGNCPSGLSCGVSGIANQCGCACSLPHASTICSPGSCSINVCESAWTDCNKQSTDGCEIDTANDPKNCGVCGQECVFAHATSKCAAGACQLGTCESGYADCNGNPGDGCESNLKANPLHCGACGTVCSGAGGTPVCNAGICGVSNCQPGTGDCDGNQGNGCETNLTSSADNCGACTNVCALPYATSACAGGACVVATCDAGHGDCDSNPANGCETSTSGSAQHCGSCSNSCPAPPHADATCVSGSCGISCEGGYQDCDGAASNGCEANIKTDPAHCGACATVRPSSGGIPACNNGVCGYSACSPGVGDCDANPGNGCETDLNTNAQNCGTCGSVCALANATPGCSGGSCFIASCAWGWGNCDGATSNGCETSTSSSLQNCGSCGNNCPAAQHAWPVCNGGSCGLNCDSGYQDCDGNSVNGCELNSATACAPVGAPCHYGTAQCSGGQPGCADTGIPVSTGTPCGSGMVCNSGGACVACASGSPCAVSNVCKLGAIDCSTGSPVCTEVGDAPSSQSCDDGHACTAPDHCLSGSCTGTPLEPATAFLGPQGGICVASVYYCSEFGPQDVAGPSGYGGVSGVPGCEYNGCDGTSCQRNFCLDCEGDCSGKC